MRSYFLFICILFVSFYTPTNAFSQQPFRSIEWKQMTEPNIPKNKLLFIDVYTSWCGWCKELDRTTFKDSNLVSYLNTYYTPIKFNAEIQQDIIYNNKQYTYNNEYGVHNLAIALANGKMAFPLILIINPENNQTYAFPGYKKAKDFELIVKFFQSEKVITEQRFMAFRSTFVSTWK